MSTSDTSGKKADFTITQLPKPVTVTGSAFEEDEKEELQAEDTQVEETDQDSLPMPAAFGDDDDDNNSSTDEDEDKSSDDTFVEEASKPQAEETLPSKKEEETEDNLTEEQQIPQPIESNTPTEEFAPVEAASGDKPPVISVPPSQPENDTPAVLQQPEPQTVAESPAVTSENTTTENSVNTFPAQEQPVQSEGQAEEENLLQDDFAIPNLQSTATLSTEPQQNTNAADIQNPFTTATNEVDTILHTPKTPQMQPPSTQEGNLTPPTIPSNNFSDEPSGKGTFGKIALGLVAVAVGGSLVAGGYFAANKLFNSGETPQQAVAETQTSTTPTIPTIPSPTPMPTTEPEPSPEPGIDKTELVVKVLNGSGEKGAAAAVKKLLEKDGFEDVKTGNANNFKYVETIVDYKEEYESLFGDIKQALGSSYDVTQGEILEDDDDYDILVTIGKKVETEESSSSETDSSEEDE